MTISPDILLSLAGPIGILVLISTAARAIHLLLFERYFKLTFEDAPVWSLFYFAFWTTLVALLFPQEIKALFGPISIIGYLILTLLLLVIFPGVYQILRKKIGNPVWLAKLFPGQGMLSLEERYIVAKIGDVIFQQCVAGVIILILAAQGFEYPQIVGVFVVLFILAHVYLFRTSGFIWGMHYTTYATFGGFIFPFFVVYISAGIAYGIVFHMLFYVLSAAFFAKLPHPPSAAISRELIGVSSPRTNS